MTSLHIRLEAQSSAHRCRRAYEIAAGEDLFGVWLVEMNYGRIGTAGRTKARSFPTEDGAEAQIEACLRKRASAPRRIGVAYRIQYAEHGEDWRQSELDRQLCNWFGWPGHMFADPKPDRP